MLLSSIPDHILTRAAFIAPITSEHTLQAMDTLQYDAYSTYSDGSAPRTPSPGSSLSLEDTHYQHSPSFFKPAFEADSMPPSFSRDDPGFAEVHHPSGGVAPEWAHAPSHGAGPGRLMADMYDHDLPAGHGPSHHPHDMYVSHSAEPPYGGSEWSGMHPHAIPDHHHHHHTLPPMRAPHDNMMRRNTFPYVNHDRDVHYSHPPPGYEHPGMMTPYGTRGDVVYGEPMPMHGSPAMLGADPSALHGDPYMASPHAGYAQLDDVKLEEGPMVVPSQQGFYRPPSSGGMPMPPYLSPHTGLPIQHTDDAASKETQYLRRRCFNCHTTEPPSWRRSTLNPGKIVCNKCGLYERTHLRPRPLRFDELRAGNKARKNSKGGAAASPKQRGMVKKEPHADAISRRASVSSTVSSLSGSSDWDDAGKPTFARSSSYQVADHDDPYQLLSTRTALRPAPGSTRLHKPRSRSRATRPRRSCTPRGPSAFPTAGSPTSPPRARPARRPRRRTTRPRSTRSARRRTCTRTTTAAGPSTRSRSRRRRA